MSVIFISHPTPTGHTWTITSKLGDMLNVAEQKYGPRDYSYTILGIEFNQAGHPRIWYPGNRKHAVIQISMNCMNDFNRAVYQVAHEAIHCLCLTGVNKSNYLEEGLATVFSIDYSLQNGHGMWTPDDQKYTDASIMVRELLAIDDEIIKKLRVHQPNISEITKELILEVNANVPEALADNLTQSFNEPNI